jgi:hypothetical protein
MNKLLILILCVFTWVDVFCQPNEKEYYKTDTINSKKNFQMIILPVVFYTPETQFGFGAGLQTFFYNKSNIYNSRESNILFTGMYTTENQLMIDVFPKIFFNLGDLFLDGLIRYRVFPNKFWGIGTDTPESNKESYNMETLIFEAAILKRLPPDLNFGFQYKYDKYTILETEEGGILQSGEVPGSEGARISAISFIFNLDDRDNIFSTRKGNFMQLKAGFSSKVIGATHSYNKYTIDLRKESTFGDVPFQTMAWLGGGDKTRGYFKGRFIDNNMYAMQAEYRNRFRKRWEFTAFASIGEVAHEPFSYFSSVKYSFGGGIRYQILKSNPTLIRLDFGLGKDGNNGIYFGVNEAF